LYALKFPERVDRIVQIGAMAPDSSKRYPSHLTNTDSTLQEFFVKMQELEKERASTDPIQFCKKFWSLLRPIYVANPADADKLKWENCHLITERNLMPHLMNNLLPSIHKATVTAASAAGMKASVLTVHGTKDRSSPYGGAVDWVSILPNARLLTVEGAAHAPWIEAPEKVFGAVRAFLKGSV
jgi:pimeloyl-ACP methyl ester carboxylesterase